MVSAYFFFDFPPLSLFGGDESPFSPPAPCGELPAQTPLRALNSGSLRDSARCFLQRWEAAGEVTPRALGEFCAAAAPVRWGWMRSQPCGCSRGTAATAHRIQAVGTAA